MSRLRIESAPPGLPIPPGGDEVVHLVLDDPARGTNVLDAAALAELDAALGELAARPGLAGVVVRGGEPGSFATGADVEALGPVADREAARAAILRVQQVLGRLAALSCPTVAAVDGLCLGVGAELALACGSRVAADEPRTRIGLPDVLLGFLPAFGALPRLVRLVGTSAALELTLDGRLVGAREAEALGLVARAVPAAWLLEHAHRRLGELAAGGRDRPRARGLGARLTDGTAAGRALALSRAAARTRARTRGEYPAPVALLSVVRHGDGAPIGEALRLAAEWGADLAVDPVCRDLVRASRLGAGEPPGGAAEVRRMHVVGAGPMGAALAELAAHRGLEVRLRDGDPVALARALRAVRARVAARRARARVTPPAAEAQLARVHPTIEPAGLGRDDLAIELVDGELEAKRRVFGELEVRMRPDALLATGDGTVAVDELAAGLGRPERLVGLHFLHPLERRPLVEVVRGAKTADTALATAVAFVRRLGRIPLVVRDLPGLAVDRVVMAGGGEALRLVAEGHRGADVDAALRGFGMARGPLETLREMGPVVPRLASLLAGAFPERFAPAPPLEALAAGAAGGARRPRPALRGALVERVVLAMVNEAACCLADNVVADAAAMDLAALHGAGFPPFRGGLLRYADTLGLVTVEARLNALRAEKGERFRPAPLLARLAAEGGSFTGIGPG